MLADNNEERTPNDKIPDPKKYLAEQADRTLVDARVNHSDVI
jgi:hypothetical protein